MFWFDLFLQPSFLFTFFAVMFCSMVPILFLFPTLQFSFVCLDLICSSVIAYITFYGHVLFHRPHIFIVLFHVLDLVGFFMLALFLFSIMFCSRFSYFCSPYFTVLFHIKIWFFPLALFLVKFIFFCSMVPIFCSLYIHNFVSHLHLICFFMLDLFLFATMFCSMVPFFLSPHSTVLFRFKIQFVISR
jgi:hypothetical protein